jgi:membrane protease YdiL (CAAX protease family)
MSLLRPRSKPKIEPSARERLAEELRGFGPLGIVAILAIILTGNIILDNLIVLPIGAVLVLVWVWLSHTPWHEIGYVPSRNWTATVAGGIAFGISFKLLMKAVVMPLFGADPVNHAFHFLTGNRAMLPKAVWLMLAAGFGEETVFRGYTFERLGKLFGSGPLAKSTIVLITSTWFAWAHYSLQGRTGTEQAAVVGLLYGAIFAFTGRLFMLMIAHASFDLTALALIYWNLESRVAHLVFR